MQDKYAADVGDFGKYALLKCITLYDSQQKDKNPPACRLGVIWYKTDPKHTDREHQVMDGKHIRYLGLAIDPTGKVADVPRNKDGKDFECCDPTLYQKLQKIARSGRSVAAIEEANILGENVTYFSKLVSSDRRSPPEQKRKNRETWLQDAIQGTDGCDVVFLDPDNGLLNEENRNGSRADDAKYVLPNELDQFWGGGLHVLVLYHHPNRKDKNVGHDQQIQNQAEWIMRREAFKQAAIFPLRYRRGTSRVFFVIVPKVDSEYWHETLTKFVESRLWPTSGKSGRAFELKAKLQPASA